MKTLDKTNLDELNQKLISLLDDPSAQIDAIEKAADSIKEAQRAKKKADFKARLDSVNKEHERRRNLLSKWLDVQFPKEDITNQDGGFHTTKMRKINGLVELVTGGCVRAKFKNGNYVEIKTGRDSFWLLKPEYKHNEPTEYIPFETLGEACYYNGIKPEKVPLSKAWSNAQKIEKEGEKIRKLIEKHKDKVASLDKHFLENENLINRVSEGSLYTNKI